MIQLLITLYLILALRNTMNLLEIIFFLSLTVGPFAFIKGILIYNEVIDINLNYRKKYASKKENIEYATKIFGKKKRQPMQYISKHTNLSLNEITKISNEVLEKEKRLQEEKILFKQEEEKRKKELNMIKNNQLYRNMSYSSSTTSENSENISIPSAKNYDSNLSDYNDNINLAQNDRNISQEISNDNIANTNNEKSESTNSLLSLGSIAFGIIVGGLLGIFFVWTVFSWWFVWGAPIWLYIIGGLIGGLAAVGNLSKDKEEKNFKQEQIELLKKLNDKK